MPISRYEIRNEYSLADPELYRAADKDDPEALLEGVAMAGLVGVLRQLGDLAEFAADIFHNLHEDVMATAARGHVLAVRVQQLENEIPSVERAFLSQTDHSSFFYHPGLDWHPNLRPDKNLVTQGDLPRFIMDSYEECRAPPRLFLLDKFDVAGAGACLKRYTDPSFYKVETAEMTTDIQREKKTRKTKKKGPRWKNREAPEVLPTSHTKLHQLFLEERVENGVSAPSRRAKLKRRLNGFPFNSRTGKSYMEKILKSPSSDHEMLHDMNGDSPELKLATNDHEDFGSEIFEFRPVSPNRESGGRKRSTRSSPDREGVALHPRMYDPDEYPIDDKIFEISSSHPSTATNDISSALTKVTGEKVVAVDAEINREGSLTGYGSDDMASEIDNYVDAPSTMESELDRDSDLRMKNENTSDIKMETLIIDAYEEPLHSRSSDSQSTGDSTTSDVGNNSSTKEISSFTSDSPDISAEKPPSESSSKAFECTDIPVNVIAGASSYQETVDEDFPVDHHSRPVVSDDACTETNAITNHRSSDLDEVTRKCLSKPSESDENVSTLDDEEENTYQVVGPPLVVSDGSCTETNAITNQRSEFEQVTSTLSMNGSMPTYELSDPGEALGNFKVEAPGSDEMVSELDDIENINLVIDPPCSPSAILGLQTGDDLSRSSDGEQLLDEPNGESKPCLSAEHSSVKTSSSVLLHEDESDGEDQELTDDAASTLNIQNVLSVNGDLNTMSSGNRIQDGFEQFPEVPENSVSDYPDAANNGDNIEPKGDNLIDMWDDEDSNVSTDSQNHFPCITEASPGKGIEETPLVSARTLNVEDNHSNGSIDNQIRLENLKLSHLANSPDRPVVGCDVHEGDIIPEEDTAVNETLPPEIPEPCEVVALQGTGISYHVSPNDSEALERLHGTSEDLEEPAETSDTVEIDGISPCSVSNAQEVIENTSSADLRPENEIHDMLHESGLEADRSNSTDITSPVPAVSDDASLSKLVEEHNDCFEDSCIDELENDNNCPSECHGKLDLVEKVGPTEASASDFGTIGCNSVDNDHPKSEISGLVPNSPLDLELDHSPEFFHAAKLQSSVEQCGLDREQELFNGSSLENHVSDAPSLPIDNGTEESVQDNIGLPPSHLDQDLLHRVEISSDDGKGESNPVSAFSLANGSSPPSISELSGLSNSEINVPGYSKDSIFLASNPFLEANQINLADLPPLPPLPPVQWRMGKLQHALPSAEEETIRNEDSFPQLISLTTPTDDVGSTLSTKPTGDVGSTLSTKPIHDVGSTLSTKPTGDVGSTLSTKPIHDVGSTLSTKPTHDGASPPTASTDDIISLREDMKDSPTELASETTSKEENLDSSCSSSDAKTLHETTDHPPKVESKPQLLAAPISESVSTSSATEDGAENGNQRVKLLRPRNPLVDDVSFLDKSKLRKVTERVMPEIKKVDERDSLLEQIRTKSFNLRPAMASRPSIRARGPNTNLKVVAILEKANAIRQALAGSDEDDDGNWSE